MTKWCVMAMVLGLGGVEARADDLVIRLAGKKAVSRKTVRYSCDAVGAALGVAPGPLAVEYLNGAGNSLAVVPIHGDSLILANVSSGSGARYVAQNFTWWESKGNGMLILEGPQGKQTSNCKRLD